MGKIVVSENITLDGVVQDPTGEEGSKHGGWFLEVEDKDRQEWGRVEFQEALDAEALLLGRRSYEYFAAGWSSRPGEWADRLRSMPKYVVSSSSLDGPDWTHASVIKSDAIGEISSLKQRLDGEIVVYGSRQLVRTLMDHDLVDEVRLTVYPVVLGAGERLFDDLADKTSLRLAKATTIGDGFAFLTYEVVRNS
jgi:dihydrofolate reductase